VRWQIGLRVGVNGGGPFSRTIKSGDVREQEEVGVDARGKSCRPCHRSGDGAVVGSAFPALNGAGGGRAGQGRMRRHEVRSPATPWTVPPHARDRRVQKAFPVAVDRRVANRGTGVAHRRHVYRGRTAIALVSAHRGPVDRGAGIGLADCGDGKRRSRLPPLAPPGRSCGSSISPYPEIAVLPALFSYRHGTGRVMAPQLGRPIVGRRRRSG